MIVLDTHVFVWWVSGSPSLSDKARAAIRRESDAGSIVVSSISVWEIAMLVVADRLVLSMGLDAWLETAKRIEALRILPVDAEIALESVRLPGDFHRDPADRMIVATARKLALPLVTKDRKIRDYAHVRTVW